MSPLNDILARLGRCDEADVLARDAAAFIRAQATRIEYADEVIHEARICIESCVEPAQPHICHAARTLIKRYLGRT